MIPIREPVTSSAVEECSGSMVVVEVSTQVPHAIHHSLVNTAGTARVQRTCMQAKQLWLASLATNMVAML